MQETYTPAASFDVRIINLRSTLHGMTDGDVARLNRLVRGLGDAQGEAPLAKLRQGLNPAGKTGREFGGQCAQDLLDLLGELETAHGPAKCFGLFMDELNRHNAMRNVPDTLQKIEPEPLFNPSKWIAIAILLGLAVYFVQKYLSMK
ncbi:hypothetical protein SAMN04488503_0514 [Humidesulfovibrio mexicanus]|jgi:hypothetical protein|uniref:Uncharacterized protein n=1 Tax=Humidesulfovibrio mexicanus TaxID=147047 RepID=A0A238XX94_9BACT|nr:hypothetical protein [Humidesulfovibrio mexicanus]SNR63615.1 hypothetical protein SAMN04488503_0514 [Humidesulfovibrio mexicanus]